MTDITPSDTQAKIIKDIVEWYRGGRNTPQVFYLAGYAGVGKSTIAKFVVDELSSSYDFTAIPAAYTGKAANVLRQKGNAHASTFHGGMYIPKPMEDGEVEFIWSPDAPFSQANLIIGDECSMINEVLGQDAEAFGKKILIMGDPGQLPPIEGAGYWTNRKPDVLLTEVMRQALDSPIIRLATMARNKKRLPLGEWRDADGNEIKSLDYNSDTSEEYNEWMLRDDYQAIVGVHKHRFYYTKMIRDRAGLKSVLPQLGERVICVKNDKQLGLFNGCFGTLLSPSREMNPQRILFDVKMDDLHHPFRNMRVHPGHFRKHVGSTEQVKCSSKVQEFDFGYILTCHKAQGSEFDNVSVLDDSYFFREHRYRWLYTAITRASKQLTVLNR